MKEKILNDSKTLIRVVFFGAPACYMGLCMGMARIDRQLNVRSCLEDSMKVWVTGCALLVLFEFCTDIIWLFLTMFCVYLAKIYNEAFPFLWIKADTIILQRQYYVQHKVSVWCSLVILVLSLIQFGLYYHVLPQFR